MISIKIEEVIVPPGRDLCPGLACRWDIADVYAASRYYSLSVMISVQKTIRHYHKPQKIVKKIVYTAEHYRNGAECYFCTTSKDSVNVITGVIRSFV
jgi:hypothetical protein